MVSDVSAGQAVVLVEMPGETIDGSWSPLVDQGIEAQYRSADETDAGGGRCTHDEAGRDDPGQRTD